MTARNYSNTATDATCSALLGPADLTVGLADFGGFPASPFIAAIDPDTVDEEIVLVTNVAGSTVTMTRGYDGTTAKSHSAGAVFRHVAAAKDFQEANAHVNATTGVHGLAGALVGTTDAQTLSNKVLTSPVISSPTVTGTASMASAAFSGTITVADATVTSLSVTDLEVVNTLDVGGAFTGASASLTGNLTVGGTGAFTGLVTAATAPTAGSHLVNKTYADALGTASSTANTIMRRDSSGNTAIDTITIADAPTANNHGTRKDYVDTAVKVPQVASMAARPTTGRYAGQRIYDLTTKQEYQYDGTYWRNALAGHFTPSGTSPGDYITGRAGMNTVTTDASGNALVPYGHTYADVPAIVNVSNTNGNAAGAPVSIYGLSSTTTATQLGVGSRDQTGAALGSGRNIRVGWHVIGYNS